MKFLTLEGGQLGALIDTTVVDIPAAAVALSATCPAETLQALVEAGDGEAERLWALALRAREQGVAVRDFADVKPGAPLPEPRRNILCLGSVQNVGVGVCHPERSRRRGRSRGISACSIDEIPRSHPCGSLPRNDSSRDTSTLIAREGLT